MASTRPPAVAGTFYPAEPELLRQTVSALLDDADPPDLAPKAIVAPHAGYVYSGPVAAMAYATLAAARAHISRVVLLGPAHRVWLQGLALPSAQAFATPLGVVTVDAAAARTLSDLPQVRVDDRPHANEHGLEVHLPFLQVILGPFHIVPLVVGEATAEEVGAVIERLWSGPDTLVVVSTDLSHYHDQATAQRLDAATTRAIESLRYEDLDEGSACGRVPLAGLLWVTRRRGLTVQTLDVRTSGDTAGPRDRVVGYGAYAIH